MNRVHGADLPDRRLRPPVQPPDPRRAGASLNRSDGDERVVAERRDLPTLNAAAMCACHSGVIDRETSSSPPPASIT
jgi:hypothetical protein